MGLAQGLLAAQMMCQMLRPLPGDMTASAPSTP